MNSQLSGMRVLVVEDETLVAILLEDMLTDLGCEVIGLAARVGAAREMVERNKPDCVILDVNVGGEMVYPVAEMLEARGVPFVFVTGYSGKTVVPRFQTRPTLQKPFECDQLRTVLSGLRVAAKGSGRRRKIH